MRPRALPLLLVLLSAFWTPAATASVLTAEAVGPAVTDGRSIAFSQRTGEIRVVRGGAVEDVDVAATCGQAPVQVHAIGAGQVLYACGGGAAPVPQRLDLASRETHSIPGAADLIADNAQAVVPFGVTFDGIGAAGVSFISNAYHAAVRGALDWRTGETVVESRDARQAIDLDHAGLMTPICAPLRKAVTGDGAETLFWPFHYRKPYALVETGRLTLRRCGSARRVVLSRHASAPQLGSRLAAWFETLDSVGGDYRASAYALACGRRASWPVSYGSRVAPLTRSVVISEPVSYGGPWRIRQVSVRGICRHALARR